MKHRRSRPKRYFGKSWAYKDLNHFDKFLIFVVIMLLRNLVKKKPEVSQDVRKLEQNTLEFLGRSSLLELIEHLAGEKFKLAVITAFFTYKAYSVGSHLV